MKRKRMMSRGTVSAILSSSGRRGVDGGGGDIRQALGKYCMKSEERLKRERGTKQRERRILFFKKD